MYVGKLCCVYHLHFTQQLSSKASFNLGMCHSLCSSKIKLLNKSVSSTILSFDFGWKLLHHRTHGSIQTLITQPSPPRKHTNRVEVSIHFKILLCFGKKLDEVGWKFGLMLSWCIANLAMMTCPLQETCKKVDLRCFSRGRPLWQSSQYQKEEYCRERERLRRARYIEKICLLYVSSPMSYHSKVSIRGSCWNIYNLEACTQG